MLILIHGKDNFRSSQYLKQLQNDFIKTQDPQKLNTEIFNFEENEISPDFLKKITTTMLNPSFFGQKKMVILKNFFCQANQEMKNELIKFLAKQKNISDEVIFYEKKQIPQASLKKLIIKIQNFLPLKPYELEKWVREKIQFKGAGIEQQALAQLCFEVGNDLAKMEEEINKLINYNQKTEPQNTNAHARLDISLESVNLLVNHRNEENIFLLTDALASRNKKRALDLLKDQFSLGVHPLYLLKMFAFAFRNLLIVKELLEKKFNLSNIKEKTKLHPFLLQKVIQQAKVFEFEELKKIYLKLIDLDYAIKTGRIDEKNGLEIFVSLL